MGSHLSEGPSLAITAMFCLEFAYVFQLSVSIRKVASKHLMMMIAFIITLGEII